MRILYCDDVRDRAAEVAQAISRARPDATVETVIGDDLTAALQSLFRRVRDAIDAPAQYSEKYDSVFDAADLVIVDNNLAELDIAGARQTAEAVIGFIRAFTHASYYVSLNKNSDRDFDLRFLVGDAESRADIALNTTHLEIGGLWSHGARGAPTDFRPWYWPRLDEAPTQRRAQVAFVLENLDKPVLRSLDLPVADEAFALLSSHARGSLSELKEDVRHVTFADVFETSSRSLPAREERLRLLSAFREGNGEIGAVIARVVAADLDMWLRRDVLAPQEILVDLPHLLSRMPFLLGDGVSDVKRWNEAVAATTAPFGLDPELFDKYLKAAQFKHAIWHPTPAFHWPTVKANDALDQLFFTSNQESWADVVFCEDRSQFVPRHSANESLHHREFLAEFDGPWRRRSVTRIDPMRYAPMSLLD